MSTGVSINVHVSDGTTFRSNKVTDFVSLQVGPDINLFLLTPEQALALYKAAGDAFNILYAIRAERDAEKELESVQIELDPMQF